MNRISKSIVTVAVLGGAFASAANAAPVGWTPFAIRGAPVIINDYLGNTNQVQFIVNGTDATFGGSDKAALGTNLLNGKTIGQIEGVAITRFDDHTRFATSEGSYYAPYMNIWVKDAQGDVAVLANEPSNAEWPGTTEWNTSGANLLTKSVKLFEQEGDFDLPTGVTLGSGGLVYKGGNLATFSDFASYVIDAPAASFLATFKPNGSGAPRENGTFTSYGFNWVFGDTGGNFTGDTTGYIVGNAVVPEPTGLAALALGGLALLARRRGNRAARV